MCGRNRRATSGEAGFMTVQYLLAVGMSLMLLTAVANVIVFQYGRGVVRAALDEGVRTGSRATASAADCEARAGAALRDLLGGAMGAGVRFGCDDAGTHMRAQAQVTFRAWAPMVPDWAFTVQASAVREHAP